MAGGKHLLGKPKGKHIFGTARVGEKGQIVIPKEARTLFGVQPGDTLLILGLGLAGFVLDTAGGVLVAVVVQDVQQASAVLRAEGIPVQ